MVPNVSKCLGYSIATSQKLYLRNELVHFETRIVFCRKFPNIFETTPK